MKNDENLNKQPHWRCRLCGHSTPLDQSVCSNPSCRADLGIYGETVTPGQEDDGPHTWKQREEEAQQRREYGQRQEEEAQRQKEEEQRRREEEKAQAKAARQTGSPGGGAKWLIPALAAVLVAVLGIGAVILFSNRGTADGPTPPEKSAAPGPDESRPGQAEPPVSDGWKGNVLMSDRPGLDERSEYPAFGGKFERQEIRSITFMDSLDDIHGIQWDVSQNQDGSVMAWADLDSGTGLYDLYIGGAGGVEAPADCSHIFDSYINAERISFNGVFHTDHVTDMSCMFNFCGLSELDVSGFDTSHAADMGAMFHMCSSVTKLDLSGFDTSDVTDMYSMFEGCSSLIQLNVSGFDTSDVTDMSFMFDGCSSLTRLDVGGFDTSSVTDMAFMFSRCSGLRELNVSGFDTSNVTDMGAMFCDCSGLRELDVSGFDTSGVTSMNLMFCDCSGLQELDASGFDTSSVTNMGYMFARCSGLRELDVNGFDTSSVTDMSGMFRECSGLAELDITNFKTSNVTDMSYMFAGMNSGFALHFVRANFDTSSVTNNKGFMDDSFDWRKMFE